MSDPIRQLIEAAAERAGRQVGGAVDSAVRGVPPSPADIVELGRQRKQLLNELTRARAELAGELPGSDEYEWKSRSTQALEEAVARINSLISPDFTGTPAARGAVGDSVRAALDQQDPNEFVHPLNQPEPPREGSIARRIAELKQQRADRALDARIEKAMLDALTPRVQPYGGLEADPKEVLQSPEVVSLLNRPGAVEALKRLSAKHGLATLHGPNASLGPQTILELLPEKLAQDARDRLLRPLPPIPDSTRSPRRGAGATEAAPGEPEARQYPEGPAPVEDLVAARVRVPQPRERIPATHPVTGEVLTDDAGNPIPKYPNSPDPDSIHPNYSPLGVTPTEYRGQMFAGRVVTDDMGRTVTEPDLSKPLIELSKFRTGNSANRRSVEDRIWMLDLKDGRYQILSTDPATGESISELASPDQIRALLTQGYRPTAGSLDVDSPAMLDPETAGRAILEMSKSNAPPDTASVSRLLQEVDMWSKFGSADQQRAVLEAAGSRDAALGRARYEALQRWAEKTMEAEQMARMEPAPAPAPENPINGINAANNQAAAATRQRVAVVNDANSPTVEASQEQVLRPSSSDPQAQKIQDLLDKRDAAIQAARSGELAAHERAAALEDQMWRGPAEAEITKAFGDAAQFQNAAEGAGATIRTGWDGLFSPYGVGFEQPVADRIRQILNPAFGGRVMSESMLPADSASMSSIVDATTTLPTSVPRDAVFQFGDQPLPAAVETIDVSSPSYASKGTDPFGSIVGGTVANEIPPLSAPQYSPFSPGMSVAEILRAGGDGASALGPTAGRAGLLDDLLSGATNPTAGQFNFDTTAGSWAADATQAADLARAIQTDVGADGLPAGVTTFQAGSGQRIVRSHAPIYGGLGSRQDVFADSTTLPRSPLAGVAAQRGEDAVGAPILRVRDAMRDAESRAQIIADSIRARRQELGYEAGAEDPQIASLDSAWKREAARHKHLSRSLEAMEASAPADRARAAREALRSMQERAVAGDALDAARMSRGGPALAEGRDGAIPGGPGTPGIEEIPASEPGIAARRAADGPVQDEEATKAFYDSHATHEEAGHATLAKLHAMFQRLFPTKDQGGVPVGLRSYDSRMPNSRPSEKRAIAIELLDEEVQSLKARLKKATEQQAARFSAADSSLPDPHPDAENPGEVKALLRKASKELQGKMEAFGADSVRATDSSGANQARLVDAFMNGKKDSARLNAISELIGTERVPPMVALQKLAATAAAEGLPISSEADVIYHILKGNADVGATYTDEGLRAAADQAVDRLRSVDSRGRNELPAEAQRFVPAPPQQKTPLQQVIDAARAARDWATGTERAPSGTMEMTSTGLARELPSAASIRGMDRPAAEQMLARLRRMDEQASQLRESGENIGGLRTLIARAQEATQARISNLAEAPRVQEFGGAEARTHADVDAQVAAIDARIKEVIDATRNQQITADEAEARVAPLFEQRDALTGQQADSAAVPQAEPETPRAPEAETKPAEKKPGGGSAIEVALPRTSGGDPIPVRPASERVLGASDMALALEPAESAKLQEVLTKQDAEIGTGPDGEPLIEILKPFSAQPRVLIERIGTTSARITIPRETRGGAVQTTVISARIVDRGEPAPAGMHVLELSGGSKKTQRLALFTPDNEGSAVSFRDNRGQDADFAEAPKDDFYETAPANRDAPASGEHSYEGTPFAADSEPTPGPGRDAIEAEDMARAAEDEAVRTSARPPAPSETSPGTPATKPDKGSGAPPPARGGGGEKPSRPPKDTRDGIIGTAKKHPYIAGGLALYGAHLANKGGLLPTEQVREFFAGSPALAAGPVDMDGHPYAHEEDTNTEDKALLAERVRRGRRPQYSYLTSQNPVPY